VERRLPRSGATWELYRSSPTVRPEAIPKTLAAVAHQTSRLPRSADWLKVASGCQRSADIRIVNRLEQISTWLYPSFAWCQELPLFGNVGLNYIQSSLIPYSEQPARLLLGYQSKGPFLRLFHLHSSRSIIDNLFLIHIRHIFFLTYLAILLNIMLRACHQSSMAFILHLVKPRCSKTSSIPFTHPQ